MDLKTDKIHFYSDQLESIEKLLQDSSKDHDSNNYWEQLERMEKLIRAAEVKSGVIFSFHSLILGLFVDRMDYFQSVFEESIAFTVLTVIWISLVIVSIYFCFKCFRPQIETKYEKNVFFFRDAVHSFGSVDDYSKTIMGICKDGDKLSEQLSHQIHVESKIIDEKFKSVNSAIKYFGLSFVVILMLIGLWLIRIYI